MKPAWDRLFDALVDQQLSKRTCMVDQHEHDRMTDEGCPHDPPPVQETK